MTWQDEGEYVLNDLQYLYINVFNFFFEYFLTIFFLLFLFNE
jgi:hypothetical protein